jgi:hypothetical protein
LISLQQQSYRDATNDEGKDDDRMNVRGQERRRNYLGTLAPAGGADWLEDSWA